MFIRLQIVYSLLVTFLNEPKFSYMVSRIAYKSVQSNLC